MYALLIEEDYCSPPIATERESVLDRYFDDLIVVVESEKAGWAKIKDKPNMWAE